MPALSDFKLVRTARKVLPIDSVLHLHAPGLQLGLHDSFDRCDDADGASGFGWTKLAVHLGPAALRACRQEQAKVDQGLAEVGLLSVVQDQKSDVTRASEGSHSEISFDLSQAMEDRE